MLPTKGYFQDIECPFYNTTCGRPYCHFRHKRKPNENVEDNVQDTSKNVVPTYKPTPKSELANIHNSRSHIPISYVPDLAFNRERTVRPIRIEKPTYNPTPLSILSSATKPDNVPVENQEHQETIKDIQENIASNVYDPVKSEINFEDLSNEFELIDDIINDSSEGPQDFISQNLIKLENDIEKEQNKLNLLKSGIDGHIKIESDQTKPSTAAPEFSSDEDHKSGLAEKKKVNQISIKVEKEWSDKDKSNKSSENKDHKNDNKSKSSHKDKFKSSDKGKNKDRSKEKSSRERDLKKSEKSHKNGSEQEKHRKEEKKNSSKDLDSSKDKHQKGERSKSPKKSTKKHSKNKSETISESSFSDNSPERHRKEKKSDSSKSSKHKSREKSLTRSVKNEKKSKTSNSRSKSRSVSREKYSKSKRKSERSRSQTRHKEEDKKQGKNKDKRQKDSDKHKDKDKAKSNSKEKTSSSTSKKSSQDNKKEKRSKLTSESNYSTSDNDNEQYLTQQEALMDSEDLVPSDVDLDLDDEDETMRECYKIFNEYKPEPIKQHIQVEEVEKKDSLEEDNSIFKGKKRTAHAGAENSRSYSKLTSVAPPKSVSLPGQILTNRYKIARMAQGSNEQENIMNEVKSITQQPVKRPATSLLEAARLHKIKRLQQQKPSETEKPNVNIVDDILSGVYKPNPSQVKILPKKIAAVPNVALIEKAKQRISLVKQRVHNVKTTAQTPKGSRVAHVPEYTLSDIPDVIQAEKSKLPVNVRTRFLTMIVDECSKLYALKDDAYNRALNEEFSCYEKCKVLATYRNSAMLAVNRIRKEVQERENKGLGPLVSGETALNKKETDFEGKTFYDHVRRWVLAEEDLDVHGYPRESGERGRAIINNRTQVDYSIVDENQRKCSRCGKIYQVDDDGWPLFDEECMYHPLKKRTIRGEQIFLCCKSNDDTGCATSDTHVFDGTQSHLLEGYQTTLPPESDDDVRSIQVYALDCEMCYTTKGLELTRVTVVDTECKTVYESFVKPLNPIIDYNTRFSGITKDQMDRTSTSILQVQANILHLCNSETILVGHSLESDMKALKIVHGTVIDTSVLFPHKMGLPHKRALRALASEYLKKIIQNDVAGHDSAEDAVACMDLIKWKLKEELKTRTK